MRGQLVASDVLVIQRGLRELAASRPPSSEQLMSYLPRIAQMSSVQLQQVFATVVPLCKQTYVKAPSRRAYEELVLNGPTSGEEPYRAALWYQTTKDSGVNIPLKLSRTMGFNISPEDITSHFETPRDSVTPPHRVVRPNGNAINKFLEIGGSHSVDTYQLPLWRDELKNLGIDDEAIRFLLQSAAQRTIDREEYQKFSDPTWVKRKPGPLENATQRLNTTRTALGALEMQHRAQEAKSHAPETAQQSRHIMKHIAGQMNQHRRTERAAQEYIREHTPITASMRARRARRSHTIQPTQGTKRGGPDDVISTRQREAEEESVRHKRSTTPPPAPPPPLPPFEMPKTPIPPKRAPPQKSLLQEFQEMGQFKEEEPQGEFKEEQFKEVRTADPYEAQPDILGRWLDKNPPEAELKQRMAKFEKRNMKVKRALQKTAKDLEFVNKAFTVFGTEKKRKMKTIVQGLIKGDLDSAIWLKRYRFKKFKKKFPGVTWANEAWNPNMKRAKSQSEGGDHDRDADRAALREILTKLEQPGDTPLKVQDYSALYRAIGAPASFLNTLKDVTRDIHYAHSSYSKTFSENEDAISRMQSQLLKEDRDADLEDVMPVDEEPQTKPPRAPKPRAKKKPRRGEVHSGVQEARAETKKKAAAKKRKPKPKKEAEGRAAETAQEMDRGRPRAPASSSVRTRSQPTRPRFAIDMDYPTRQALREKEHGHDTKRAAIGRRSADITRLGAARAHSPQDRRRRSEALTRRSEEISARARSAGRRKGAYVRRRSRALHRGGSPTGRR